MPRKMTCCRGPGLAGCAARGAYRPRGAVGSCGKYYLNQGKIARYNKVSGPVRGCVVYVGLVSTWVQASLPKRIAC